jgi:hypothetical protein
MDIREAEENLQLIRSMMERATRWTGLPAYACFGAAACGFAGWALSASRGLDFSVPGHAAPLFEIWGAVAGIAAISVVAFTIAAARRRGEPALSSLTRSIMFSILPGLFTGGVLTFVAPPEMRPGVWMLCYGTSLLGLGVFAGWKANLTGALFLAGGSSALLAFPSLGLTLMAATFGGLHALLGSLLLLKPSRRGAEDLP